ncbi:MAG: DUF6695 family protein, partial [Bacteroidota bacterium]
ACDQVDYDRTMHYVHGLQSRGPIAYGPFAFGGSNCSRFVANALYAGCVSKKVRLKLTYPRSLTPTPLGTVINGDTVGTIWEVNEGQVSRFNGTKWSPVREVIWQFGDTPMFKLNREEEDRNWLEGSLIEPERPDDLPDDATWFGAIGSGAWFRLTQPDSLEQNEFRFQRYNAYGVVDCDRVVVPRIGQLNARESFTLTYETNCRFCTVMQGGEKVVLESIREYPDIITLPVDAVVDALPVRN